MNTVTAKSGYANRQKDPERTYPIMTSEQARKLYSGAHVSFLDRNDTVRTAKVTSVKTWKTRPDVEIHIKYGMYENAITTFTAAEASPIALLGPAID